MATASTFLESFSPPDLKQEKIRIALSDPRHVPLAFEATILVVSLDVSIVAIGLVLPIELLITGPSAASFRQHFFRRLLPSTITLIPREGGPHQILLREVAHNFHWGKCLLHVEGEALDG